MPPALTALVIAFAFTGLHAGAATAAFDLRADTDHDLHLNGGEVHCATNLLRAGGTGTPWWSASDDTRRGSR